MSVNRAYVVNSVLSDKIYGPTLPNGVTTVTNTSTTPCNELQIKNSMPTWRDRILHNLDATGPYTRSFVSLKPLFSSCYSFNSSAPFYNVVNYRGIGDLASYVLARGFATPATNAQQRNIAIRKLRAKLNGDTAQFQSLVPLAEIREVHSLLRAVTYSATDLTKALLDIKRTKGKSALKFASHAWLTFSFGIQPTMADIDSLMKSIAFFNESNLHVQRYSASSSTEWLGSSLPNNPELGGNNQDILRSYTTMIKYRHSFVAGHRFPLINSSGSFSAAQDQFGLRLGHVLPALWEATMFSWIGDYFFTVGDFLSDTWVKPPGNTLYVSEGRLWDATIRFSDEFRPKALTQLLSVVRGSGELRYVQFDRIPLGSQLPVRSLTYKSSDEVGKFAVTKLLNLASLLVR